MNSNAQIQEQLNTIEHRQTAHLLHLIATCLTGGLWLPVWVVMWLGNNKLREDALEEINRLTNEGQASTNE